MEVQNGFSYFYIWKNTHFAPNVPFATAVLFEYQRLLIVTQPAFNCSKLTIETLEPSVKLLKVNFEHILHLVLVFL